MDASGGEVRANTEDLTKLDREELNALRVENAQLQHALESRIAIEQAKGVLAERLELTTEEAFVLLRYSARSAQMPIHDLARAVNPRRPTPHAIVIGLSRSQRWRAAAQRELAEAQRETAEQERARIAQIADRLRRDPGQL